MSELQTLRWGDAYTFQFNSTNTRALGFSQFQLAKAHWHRPLVWGLRTAIVPAFNSDETADMNVFLEVTLGSGQNSTTTIFQYVISKTSGSYPAAINDFQQIPASDIQVIAKMNGLATSAHNETVVVGTYLAPLVDPFAAERMEAALTGKQEPSRFMQPGPFGPGHQTPGTSIAYPINPDPLHYKPR